MIFFKIIYTPFLFVFIFTFCGSQAFSNHDIELPGYLHVNAVRANPNLVHKIISGDGQRLQRAGGKATIDRMLQKNDFKGLATSINEDLLHSIICNSVIHSHQPGISWLYGMKAHVDWRSSFAQNARIQNAFNQLLPSLQGCSISAENLEVIKATFVQEWILATQYKVQPLPLGKVPALLDIDSICRVDINKLTTYEPRIHPRKFERKPLGYNEFHQLIATKKLTLLEAENLTDYAYYVGSPVLFRRPITKVKDTDYSINLLWLHKGDPRLGGGHVFGSDDKRFKDYVLDPIMDWQTKQPNSSINFWYDSRDFRGHYISYTESRPTKAEQAVTRSLKALKNAGVNTERVKFRDIREVITALTKNERMGRSTYSYDVGNIRSPFSSLFKPDIPIYFRVDLAKALIGDHLVRREGLKYAVNTDADIPAVCRDQLLNDRTLTILNKRGFLFADLAGHNIGENGFIILQNNPVILQESHDSIILGSIKAAEKYLVQMLNPKYTDIYRPCLEQAVFQDAYPAFKKRVQSRRKNDIQELNQYRWVNEDAQTSPVRGDEPHTNGFPIITAPSQFGFVGYRQPETIKTLSRLLADK